MAVIRVKNGFEGWRKVRPPTLPRLPFCDLQPNTLLIDSHIQSVIVTKWPVKKYKDTNLLKVVVQEVISDDKQRPKLGTEKLQVFIIGSIVRHWETINIGDYLCMSDVSVEGGQRDTCRIVIEENKHRTPRIWVLKNESPVSDSRDKLSGPAAPKPASQIVLKNESRVNDIRNKPRDKPSVPAVPKPAPQSRLYKYTSLKDLKSSTIVNVWGVVKFLKPPAKSRGQDYVQTLSIVDPTLTGADEKVICQLFAPRPENLLKDNSIGHIIRLHRLRITIFNGKLQGGSGPGFSWLLFGPSTQNSIEPVLSSSVAYTLNDSDKQKVTNLRQWIASEKCILSPPSSIVLTDDTDRDETMGSGDGLAQDPAAGSSKKDAGDPARGNGDPGPGNVARVSNTGPLPQVVTVTPRLATHHRSVITQQLESLRAAAAAAKNKPQLTRYTELKNLRHESTANVMGVVSFVKPVSRTIRKEFLKVLSIEDHSCQTSLKCLLFAEELSLLPETVFTGQIICLHRLNITKYAGQWQGQRGRGFTWTLFESRQSAAAEQIASSRDPKLTSDVDVKKVHELQEWAEKKGLLRHQRNKTISSILPEEYVDLVCQVVGVLELEPDKCMLLRVWDGSEPVLPFCRAETEEKTPKTSRVLLEKSYGVTVDVFVFDDHFTSAACLEPGDYIALANLHALRPRGRDILTVEVAPCVELRLHGGTTYSRGLHLLHPDTDMLAAATRERLRNVAPGTSADSDKDEDEPKVCRKRQRINSTSSASTTGDKRPAPEDKPQTLKARRVEAQSPAKARLPLTLVEREGSLSPKEVFAVKDKEEEEEEEVSSASSVSRDTPRCLQRSATVMIGHHHVKTTRIDEVVTHEVPYKFRVCVQLIDFQPRVAADLYCLCCSTCQHMQNCPKEDTSPRSRQTDLCPKCLTADDKTSVEMKRILRFGLLLADDSGWMRANLWGEQADMFFADIVSFSSDEASADVISAMENLCPQPSEETGHYTRPWLECCVASYQASGETCYQVFDTMIALNDE